MGTELSVDKQAKALYGEGIVGYVAGMIDGEGCIGAYTYTSRDGVLRCIPILTITNTNKDVLDCCRMVIGGKVALIEKRREKERPLYRLQTASMPTIERALLIVRDWLIIKRDVAELVLELINSKRTHCRGCIPRELEIVTEMHELNKKGR